MFKINYGSPAILNPQVIALGSQMAIIQLHMEANMKKYFPFQYQMMKAMQAAMEKGSAR